MHGPVQIDECDSRKAASVVCGVLQRAHGNAWVVRCVADEGYQMAPASSRLASSWRRYFPETIVGEYLGGRSMATKLAHAMSATREGMKVRDYGRSEARREWERQYKARRRAMAAKHAQDVLDAMAHTRNEAQLRKAVHYYTGKPCRVGHVATRLTMTGECDVCRRDRMDVAQAQSLREAA